MLLTTDSMPSIRRLRTKYDVGLLIQPRMTGGVKACIEEGIPWAADNDAFNGFKVGQWLKMLGTIADKPGCLFVVAPDKVEDARETLRLFMQYAPIIRECNLPVAYVLQDGLEEVGVPWNLTDVVFVGGGTRFKMGNSAAWAVREAKERGKWVHMGRVNSLRRIEYAQSLGVDSIDGTKWTMYTNAWQHQLAALSHRQEALQ